jgi:uncharacterized protein
MRDAIVARPGTFVPLSFSADFLRKRLATQRLQGATEAKLQPSPRLRVEANGAFEGYASLFGVTDLAKDRVEPGAFSASLARRGPSGIRLLWQHDPAEPLGRWLSIVEDRRGLFVRGQLALDVARAREVRALMLGGAVDGLSIGFRSEKVRNDPRTGVRHLMQIDLWEISIVTFPMLPQARVSAVKAFVARDLQHAPA